ncbi:MAG: peptidyl-prolyl cis-trans isomerase [Candidatus Eisenbacteria bacterium]
MRMLDLFGALERAACTSLTVAVLVSLAPDARAQSSSPFGATAPGTPPASSPFGSGPASAVPPATRPVAPARPTARAAAPAVLARVEGRDITQAEFDVIAVPYFARLRNEMGAGFTPDVQKLARKNVFEELVRRAVLASQVQREQVRVSDEEADALLKGDPSLQTNGRYDPAKLQAFKASPQSNYAEILPRLRETAGVAKLDRQLRERFEPAKSALRAEFEKRNASARFRYLALQTREVPLEPETGPVDWQRYYDTHHGEFVQRAQVRVRWRRWPLPLSADSARAAADSAAFPLAQRTADSLRAGSAVDSLVLTQDAGWLERGAALPGLGRSPALLAAVARADSLPLEPVFGPLRLDDGIVVGKLVARRAERLPPYGDVIAEARRRADAELRRTAAEAERRAFYDTHRDRYRGTRARLTRLTLKMGQYQGRAIPPDEIDRWYQAHGRGLFGVADSSRAWLPPIDEARRREAGRRMAELERDQWLTATMAKLANALATTRDPKALGTIARTSGAVAETLSIMAGAPGDSLFPPVVADSVRTTAAARVGQVQGPRAFGAYSVVWRVDAADTAYVAAFELARARIEPDFLAEKRRKDEEDGRAWFVQHTADYPAPARHVVEYVAVPVQPVDSVRLDEATLRAEYARAAERYREPEQVRARHLLISTRDAGPGGDASAAARADSLLAAIRKGADFFELARRFSQEPGASNTGGDLGWFGRGRMVPEFERAAFALKPGEVSPVVKTQFGYHIIKLEDRKAARTKPFDEVRTDLRTTLARARADSSARRSADALRRKLAAAADPAVLAAPFGGVRTSPPFASNETLGAPGPVSGLAEEVPAMTKGRWAGKVYRGANEYLVVRPLRTEPPRAATFEDVRGRAIEDMKNARRREKLDQKVATLRTALLGGARLDSLAAPYGGLKDSGPVRRDFGFVPGLGLESALVDRAFTAPAGTVSDTVHIAQGVAWFEAQGRDPFDDKAFATASTPLAQELLKKDYDAWIEARKKTLQIEILRPEFK